MKKLLKDRQAITLLFPLVYFGMHLLGWGNEMFSWWETLLAGLVQGVFFWFFLSSFRQFRDEDVTPRRIGKRTDRP
jgi:hypothetical protein